MWYCNLRFPQRAPTTREKYTASFFNPVINETLRRVNNGHSFYDKIKPILVTDSSKVGLMLIFKIQL